MKNTVPAPFLKGVQSDRPGWLKFWQVKYHLFKYSFTVFDDFILNTLGSAELRKDPIIVLGHFRSGTTFLHNLLQSSPDHAAPNLLNIGFPEFMIGSRYTLRWPLKAYFKLFPFNMPLFNKNMDPDFINEEAMSLLFLGNPYTQSWIQYYPREYKKIIDVIGKDFCENKEGRASFTRDYEKVVRKLQFINGKKRLVLKSPQMMAKIPILLDVFPNAKFVFIMRDPRTLFASMKNYWKIVNTYNFQEIEGEEMDDLIFDYAQYLFDEYFRYKDMIPKENFIELPFEDLKADTLGSLKLIHERVLQTPFTEEHYSAYIKKDAGVGIAKRKKNEDEIKRVEERWEGLVAYHESLKNWRERV